jgi:hypothetical protein
VRAYGRRRVINALLYARGMSIRSILLVLTDIIEGKEQDEIYKIYVTDCLRIITENTGKSVSHGSYVNKRYYDIINNKQINESAEDIINKVSERNGIIIERR